jgi:hypothetical protein
VLGHQLLGMLGGGSEGIALEHHLGAPGPHRLDLDLGGDARHDDHCLDAHQLGRHGQPLGMVAGRGGDHPLGLLLLGELRHLVVGAANLERVDGLQILALDQDLVIEAP